MQNNNGQSHDMKTMWLMMLPCILMPIIFVAISGKSIGSIFGNRQWIAPVAFMVGIHVLMMKFMHAGGGNSCHKSGKVTENKNNFT